MDAPGLQYEVEIGPRGGVLPGTLGLPERARGLVVFAHGSGSSRLSARNVAVASRLVRAGLATLLFDLLTEREAADRAKVFDIGLVASRLAGAGGWGGVGAGGFAFARAADGAVRREHGGGGGVDGGGARSVDRRGGVTRWAAGPGDGAPGEGEGADARGRGVFGPRGAGAESGE